jgi:phage/plasmid-associated DNA primase
METIVAQILPDQELRNFYLTILSTGLSGIQLQYLFVLNGKGGNGKSILDDLMLNATGHYGYKIPSKLIQEDLKTGCNPEVANLNQVRFALGQEPTANKKICCSVMKELTGSEVINARNIYSSNCEVKLNLTLFLECNELPRLDEVNEAVERRIRIVPFSSKFVDQDKYQELIELGHTNVFQKNTFYTTPEFKQRYRCAFIKLLMKSYKLFVENNNNIPALPLAVKLASGNYLKQNDPYYEWFNENYEKKEKSIIYLSDIFTKFKNSDYYSKLSKPVQRELKKDNFIEKLKSNLFLSKLLVLKLRDEYVELQDKRKKINKDGFYGWAERPQEEDDDIKLRETLFDIVSEK